MERPLLWHQLPGWWPPLCLGLCQQVEWISFGFNLCLRCILLEIFLSFLEDPSNWSSLAKKKKKASDGLFPIVKCMRRKQNELQSYAGGILINEETLTAKYGQSDSWCISPHLAHKFSSRAQRTHQKCALLWTKVRWREVKISHEPSGAQEPWFNDGELEASLSGGEKVQKKKHKNCLVVGRNLLLPWRD